MVYPDMAGTVGGGDEVLATDIDSAGTYEGQVADDDVLTAAETEQSRVAIALVFVACQVDDGLARMVLSLLADALAIAQGASRATAGAHLRHACSVEGGLDLVRHLPLGAETGIVDAEDGFVGRRDADIAGDDEVAVGAVKDDDLVLAVLDGALDGALHVLSGGLQHDDLPGEVAGHGIGVAASACAVVGAAGIGA